MSTTMSYNRVVEILATHLQFVDSKYPVSVARFDGEVSIVSAIYGLTHEKVKNDIECRAR